MSAPTQELGTMHGGLRLPAHKQQTSAQPILDMPVPRRLVLPLEQHVGRPANPAVDVGEAVLRGQPIATAADAMGVPVHASSSGTVVAIEPRPVARHFGRPAPCIVIECDGKDTPWARAQRDDYRNMQSAALLSRILDGGIVGLGGAVFPTAQKVSQALTSRVDHLILNGAECEPYINCDDALMRDNAAAVVSGARILMQALQIESCRIAVESDKPVAIGRLGEALAEFGDERIQVAEIPTIYPSGAEDQLVQLVARCEVPSGGLPIDVGCLVQNVGTAAAVHDWIVAGEPLISRVTTVTGDAVASPVNVRARIGAPLEDVILAAGGYRGDPRYLVMGGPMTGKSVTTDEVPIVKASNCVLVLSGVPTVGPQLPCIRCGECAAVCPAQLLPQQLLWHARADDEQELREFGLLDCIECACCDLVCPSHIPLTAEFRTAKSRMRELADEQARAERARRRFDARNARVARERQQREAELARQKASARSAGPQAIADILARKGRGRKDTDR